MSVLSDIMRQAQVLKPKKHIMLLSHMRAYTSLFGHILGSHPEIEGYYEMHIGYYSWKSLIRQKQLYYKEHEPKDGARFIFDKILHDDHCVSNEILGRNDVIALFSLREPAETIPSIVTLYKRTSPENPFGLSEFSAKYYINRVNSLASLARNIAQQYLYLDAKSLVVNSSYSLSRISSELGLSSPLAAKYKKMRKTGKGNSGDHSANLLTGAIQKNENHYDGSQIPEELLQEANGAYVSCRESLIANSRLNILL